MKGRCRSAARQADAHFSQATPSSRAAHLRLRLRQQPAAACFCHPITPNGCLESIRRTCVSDSSLVFTGCLRSARRPSSARPCRRRGKQRQDNMLGRSVCMGCSVSLANILQQGALQQARTVGWSAACSRCWCCPHLLCCVSSLGLLGRPQHRLQQLVQLGSCHGCRGWGAAGLVCAGGGGGRAAELGGEGARAPALALDGQLTARDTGIAPGLWGTGPTRTRTAGRSLIG